MANFKMLIVADAGVQFSNQVGDRVLQLDAAGNVVSSEVTTVQLTESITIVNNLATAYTFPFTSGDWVSDNGEFALSIPPETHTKGVNPTILTYEKVGSDFVQTNVSETVSSTGLVTIRVSGSPDLRFNGLITIF
jgi:hypothetical protein